MRVRITGLLDEGSLATRYEGLTERGVLVHILEVQGGHSSAEPLIAQGVRLLRAVEPPDGFPRACGRATTSSGHVAFVLEAMSGVPVFDTQSWLPEAAELFVLREGWRRLRGLSKIHHSEVELNPYLGDVGRRSVLVTEDGRVSFIGAEWVRVTRQPPNWAHHPRGSDLVRATDPYESCQMLGELAPSSFERLQRFATASYSSRTAKVDAWIEQADRLLGERETREELEVWLAGLPTTWIPSSAEGQAGRQLTIEPLLGEEIWEPLPPSAARGDEGDTVRLPGGSGASRRRRNSPNPPISSEVVPAVLLARPAPRPIGPTPPPAPVDRLKPIVIGRGASCDEDDDTVALGGDRLVTSEQSQELDTADRGVAPGPEALNPRRLPAGFRLGGWIVERKLGGGGMGVVYLCQDAAGRRAALKLLPRPMVAEGEDTLDRRFDVETDAIRRLNHDGIVKLLEPGLAVIGANTYRFLAMQWIDGSDLTTRIAEGPISREDAVRVCLDVAKALAVAHAAGIAHRDIKPGNIMLPRGEAGRAVLIDFGIAYTVGDVHLTRHGWMVGSLSWLPRELLAIRVVGDSRPADVYALGLLLYCLLVGRADPVPMEDGEEQNSWTERVLDAKNTPFELPNEHPSTLRRLVRTMTDPDAATRLTDLSVVVATLAGLEPDSDPPREDDPPPVSVTRDWLSTRTLGEHVREGSGEDLEPVAEITHQEADRNRRRATPRDTRAWLAELTRQDVTAAAQESNPPAPPLSIPVLPVASQPSVRLPRDAPFLICLEYAGDTGSLPPRHAARRSVTLLGDGTLHTMEVRGYLPCFTRRLSDGQTESSLDLWRETPGLARVVPDLELRDDHLYLSSTSPRDTLMFSWRHDSDGSTGQATLTRRRPDRAAVERTLALIHSAGIGTLPDTIGNPAPGCEGAHLTFACDLGGVLYRREISLSRYEAEPAEVQRFEALTELIAVSLEQLRDPVSGGGHPPVRPAVMQIALLALIASLLIVTMVLLGLNLL